jgi:hypothetical protein
MMTCTSKPPRTYGDAICPAVPEAKKCNECVFWKEVEEPEQSAQEGPTILEPYYEQEDPQLMAAMDTVAIADDEQLAPVQEADCPGPDQEAEPPAPPAKEKKPRAKKPAPAQEATGDLLTDAINKIRAEMAEKVNGCTKVIGNFLLAHLDANPGDATKILAKDKTIAKSLDEMQKEAQKHRSGRCAVLTDDEGFAVVLKYYGIEDTASSKPAAPVTPKVDPPPVQEAKRSAIDFDVRLDDLL